VWREGKAIVAREVIEKIVVTDGFGAGRTITRRAHFRFALKVSTRRPPVAGASVDSVSGSRESPDDRAATDG